jgi:threonine dehydrogenase-like Zn-dependent dehydrogenase
MNLVAIPDGMSDDAGLVLTDNAPTGWYGARLGRISPGRYGAVVGLGPVGLMAAASALVMGAAQVLAVDLVESRRARAEALGAVPVEGDPRSEVFALTGGRGADVVIEAVGADATIGLATDLAAAAAGSRSSASTRARPYTFNMLMAQLKCLEFTIGMCSVQAELPALIPLTTSGRLDLAPSSPTGFPWKPALMPTPFRLPRRRRRQGRPRRVA